MSDGRPALALVVRDAVPTDRDVIALFNALLATETEGKHLDPLVLERGVAIALTEPDRLRYWVAEADGQIIGQAAITREWSDWRNGWLWWLQSVYVHQDFRGRGVFRTLYQHIRSVALELGDVIGLRLYVDDTNTLGQQTYQSMGMKPGGYHVYEEIWPDRFKRPG
ncbi:MAG TPA: GNAT family N-acetyltransferase [Isosphaeraceae bacterium]|jgi:GNAT superfamily N-acetyltransferase|nr:GNAT family N-acetyltransferase [Isosphaeraceae bacterium]